MEDGAIVEQGTHEELLAKGEAYANLYNAQFTGSRNGETALLRAAAGATVTDRSSSRGAEQGASISRLLLRRSSAE